MDLSVRPSRPNPLLEKVRVHLDLIFPTDLISPAHEAFSFDLFPKLDFFIGRSPRSSSGSDKIVDLRDDIDPSTSLYHYDDPDDLQIGDPFERVGRKRKPANNEVSLAGNFLSINSLIVSRTHLRLYLEYTEKSNRPRVMVEDLISKHGTFVNGNICVDNTEVFQSSTIRIGQTTGKGGQYHMSPLLKVVNLKYMYQQEDSSHSGISATLAAASDPCGALPALQAPAPSESAAEIAQYGPLDQPATRTADCSYDASVAESSQNGPDDRFVPLADADAPSSLDRPRPSAEMDDKNDSDDDADDVESESEMSDTMSSPPAESAPSELPPLDMHSPRVSFDDSACVPEPRPDQQDSAARLADDPNSTAFPFSRLPNILSCSAGGGYYDSRGSSYMAARTYQNENRLPNLSWLFNPALRRASAAARGEAFVGSRHASPPPLELRRPMPQTTHAGIGGIPPPDYNPINPYPFTRVLINNERLAEIRRMNACPVHSNRDIEDGPMFLHRSADLNEPVVYTADAAAPHQPTLRDSRWPGFSNAAGTSLHSLEGPHEFGAVDSSPVLPAHAFSHEPESDSGSSAGSLRAATPSAELEHLSGLSSPPSSRKRKRLDLEDDGLESDHDHHTHFCSDSDSTSDSESEPDLEPVREVKSDAVSLTAQPHREPGLDSGSARPLDSDRDSDRESVTLVEGPYGEDWGAASADEWSLLSYINDDSVAGDDKSASVDVEAEAVNERALEGDVDSAIEGDVDPAIEGDFDSAVEGAADPAVDPAVEAESADETVFEPAVKGLDETVVERVAEPEFEVRPFKRARLSEATEETAVDATGHGSWGRRISQVAVPTLAGVVIGSLGTFIGLASLPV